MNLNHANFWVDDYHKVATYKKAYAGQVRACASETNGLREVNMPKFKPKCGRPPTKRKRVDLEGQEPIKKAKRSCSHCGSGAHNVRTCPTKKGGGPLSQGSERGMGTFTPEVSQPQTTPPVGRGRAASTPLPVGRGREHAPPLPLVGRGRRSAPMPPPVGRGGGFEYLLFGGTNITTPYAPQGRGRGRGRSAPMSATRSAIIENYHHLYGTTSDGIREPSRINSQTFKPPRWRF